MLSIAYDLTHLMHRRGFQAPSGIEKVDLAFARHFAVDPQDLCAALHYRFGEPYAFEPAKLTELVEEVSGLWALNATPDEDPKYKALREWLVRDRSSPLRENHQETFWRATRANARTLGRTLALSVVGRGAGKIPEGAVYLNIAQHALEFGWFFEWLKTRPDLIKVFFIHDLLPLDHPEFWPHGYEAKFRKRISRAIALGSAFLTASESVRERLNFEIKAQGRAGLPIFSMALPTDFHTADEPVTPELSRVPYFLAVGTIEPRKNHLLLLNIWRALSSAGGSVPKLVLIGKRGWMNAETLNVIDRAKFAQEHVGECASLADSSLTQLIRNARAVLAPTYAEGFGLPIVEALACGTPVLAADIPILRDVSQNCAIYRHHLDAPGWLAAIRELTDVGSPLALEARSAADTFRPIRAPQYFAGVSAFLETL
jgi:glycosyltransferase involved in cell wall biosynthesis